MKMRKQHQNFSVHSNTSVSNKDQTIYLLLAIKRYSRKFCSTKVIKSPYLFSGKTRSRNGFNVVVIIVAVVICRYGDIRWFIFTFAICSRLKSVLSFKYCWRHRNEKETAKEENAFIFTVKWIFSTNKIVPESKE